MKYTNRLGLPEAFCNAARAFEHTRKGAQRTVTELLKPPRMAVLEDRHREELEEDVADNVWALFGLGVHKALAEHAPNMLVAKPGPIPLDMELRPGAIISVGSLNEIVPFPVSTEQTLAMEVLGWTISGTYDSYSRHDKTLTDWKTCSIYKIKLKDFDDWTSQLNIYATLLMHHGLPVEKVQVVALMRDWRPGEAKREKNYPEHQVAVIDLPLWDAWKRYEFLEERVWLHQEAEKTLALCTDSERWKQKNGTFTRCDRYCPVVTQCKAVGDEQWNSKSATALS